MMYEKAVLLKCPEKHNELVGKECYVVIDDVLTLTFDDIRLRTSYIIKHEQADRVHTIMTKSGSEYVFEETV